MSKPLTVVIDTNAYLSSLNTPGGSVALAVDIANEHATRLASAASLAELASKVERDKFRRYFTAEIGQALLAYVERTSTLVEVESTFRVCRDPRDDIFLQLAVDGTADLLLTGDKDLLTLDPFRGIRFCSPRTFIDIV